MTKVKKWLYMILCWAAWAALYGLFLRLESKVEPVMFATGQGARWWFIVLLYWIADTAVLLCFAWVAREPFGFRMPPRFPFFQLGADFAVAIFLVHLAWACTDTYLLPELTRVGLAILPKLFFFLALSWGAVALARYRQLAVMARQPPAD